MSFAFSAKETFANRPGIKKGQDGFKKNLIDAYNFTQTNNKTTSEAIVLEEQWQPIMDVINENKDKLEGDFARSFFSRKRALYNPALTLSMKLFDETRYQDYEKSANFIKKIIKDNAEILPELQDIDLDKIYKNAKQTALNKRKIFNETVENNPGAGNAIVRFAGEGASTLTDPVLLTSLMFGGAGSKLSGIALNQAIVGAGAEALAQTKIKSWYESLGLEYTSQQFWSSVALGGLIGGASPFAFNIAGKTISLTSDQITKGLKAFKDSGIKNPNVDTIEKVIEKNDDFVNSNPLDNDKVHADNLKTAERSFESNEYPDLPDDPIANPKAPGTIYETDNLNNEVFLFDPDQLEVDAELFQFKAGGDASGVTDRLAGVKKWDAVKSGQIVVYEYANGRQFIADGHQRLGLAKRLKNEGQDVKLYGIKLKEIDGYTPAETRVIAATKNIAEGSGTAVDAAKVLRVDPSKISELPRTSNLVKQARAIVNLSDNLFGMVINDKVPAKYAAVVGRLIPEDTSLQEAAMSILARNIPDNEFQADSIVQQVINAGYENTKQVSLFGDEIVAESFFVERSKILDQAQKSLRQDKNAFASLVKNAERVEAEGNQLVKSSNIERVNQDGQAIALLSALANRKGPLSEALTEAAKIARATGNFKRPSTDFLNAVRNAIREGDFERVSASDFRRSFNDTPQSDTDSIKPETSLNNFEEAAGPGSRQQANQLEEDIFGEIRRQEGFTSDIEARQDLKTKLDQGMTDLEIDNHPAVTKAIEEADKIPKTHEMDNYLSRDWFDNREFIIDGMTLKGYALGVNSLIDRAKKLAFTDEQLEVPANFIRNEKKAVIVLGPPAAGKSTYANKIARNLGAAIIDADDAKKALPEFQGGLGAAAVHEESSTLSTFVKDLVTDDGTNVVIPKVGDNADNILKQIDKLKSKGYQVTLANMDVTAENALTRMLKRFVDTGRLISPGYVRSIGSKPKQTYASLKQQGKADGYAEIDNNQKLGESPTIREDSDGIFEDIQLLRSGGESGTSGRSVDGNIPGQRLDGPSAQVAEQTSITDDLDFQIPTETIAEGGEIKARTQSLRELEAEFAQDQRMLDRLEGCVV